MSYGLLAYLIWGSFPLYIQALAPAGAVEILAQRILWSLACCVALLLAGRGGRRLVQRLKEPRLLGALALAGALISINWVTYLIAATTGRVADAALGYFLNPLVSVALGLLVLRERLRPLQAIAVGIGAAAAIGLTIEAGALPIIPLTLAFSFGTYGLVKNRVGAGLSAVQGLTAETAVLAPAAVLVLAVLASRGEVTFAGSGLGHTALLASTGPMTAVPLLLFAAAARRVSLVTVGLLQFVAPVLQFLCALALGERLSAGRWVGFAVVWLALAVLVADIVRQGLGRRRGDRPATPAGGRVDRSVRRRAGARRR